MRDTGRLTELDAMRGIAAAAVVLFHVTENLADRGLSILRPLHGTPLHPLLDGRQPVIFFFVLSGLALTRALLVDRPPGFVIYAARRVVRLCLPALAAVTVSAALFGAVHVAGDWPPPDSWLYVTSWTAPPSPASIVRQAMLLGFSGDFSLDCVLWSLAQELRLSALLPAIVFGVIVASVRFRRSREQTAGLLLVAALCVLFGASVAEHGLHDDRFGGEGVWPILASLAYRVLPAVVFAGLVSPLLSAPRPGARACVVLTICVAAGGVLGVAVGGNGWVVLGFNPTTSLLATLYYVPCFVIGAALSFGALDQFATAPRERRVVLVCAGLLVCFDSLFATSATALLLLVVARQPGRLRAWLRTPALVWLGRISFSLYLIHVPLLLGLSHGLHGVLPFDVILALWVPLTLPAAWLMHRLVEQPAQRLARRIGQLSPVRVTLAADQT